MATRAVTPERAIHRTVILLRPSEKEQRERLAAASESMTRTIEEVDRYHEETMQRHIP